ncbi:unnamed protein product [Orchesella dallaii]|uniref:Uncharacterized protein n=1 Tax=Orchesella dallaii TaxID=48710 RepID=A0ABP1PVL4_9HEXA
MSKSQIFLIVASVLFTMLLTSAQNFEAGLTDQEYLDKIQEQLHKEAVDAHSNLINQTRILQLVTRSFIASKIKENLFRAIRAEVEMMNATATNTTSGTRQSRQEEDGEEDDGSTTARPRPPGLLPQLANVVTAIFGPNVNVTEYVHSATAFLPTQVSNQLVDVVKLIDPARFTSTSTAAPPTYTQIIVNPQFVGGGGGVGIPGALNTTSASYATRPTFTTNSGSVSGSLTPGVVQQSGAAELSRNPPASSGIGINNLNAPSLQAYPTTPATVSTTDEDEEEDGVKGAAIKNTQDEENSGEEETDELADDVYADEENPNSLSFGKLEEYAAIKYAINLYKRLTRSEIPTTTEFMNTTTVLPEYEDEPVKGGKTTPPTNTRYEMIKQSGVYLYEGAREAYQLLQHINRYLDKVVYGANVDSHFAVDPDDIQLRDIADSVKQVSGAMMGLSEYVLEIRQELKSIRADLSETRSNSSTPSNSTTMRPISYYSKPVRDPEEVRRQSLELADKVERLLAMEQSPQVDLAKEELRRTVEKNFLRMLAAILVTGPAHTQERSDDIFKLMRSVLNGELDFTPVIERLPLILRDTETNQFVNLLIALREVSLHQINARLSLKKGTIKAYDFTYQSEQGGSFRQGVLNSVENTVQGSNSNRQLNRPFPRPINGQVNVPINGQFTGPTNGQYIGSTNGQYTRPINGQFTGPTTGQFNGATTGQFNGATTGQFNGATNGQFNGVTNGQFNGVTNGQFNPINTPINPANINPNIPGQLPGATQNPNQLPTINSLIDAMTQTQQLIKEIPSLVEGLQTLVETLEGLFG